MEVRQLKPPDYPVLYVLFTALEKNPYFHPHPFTHKEAKKVCSQHEDYYCGAFSRGGICTAYGMLRWGTFENPSLGIAVHPEFQGLGLGKNVMLHLHEEATSRGSEKVRLRVHSKNTAALSLYQKVGYVFDGKKDRSQLVGWLNLKVL